MCITLLLPLLLTLSLAANASDPYLRDVEAVQSLLTGAVLEGVYLRTGSDYTLAFREDGTLEKPDGTLGRWWVNEQAQYCREWLSGPLQGNLACLDLQLEGDQLNLFSSDRRVAEGRLIRD